MENMEASGMAQYFFAGRAKNMQIDFTEPGLMISGRTFSGDQSSCVGANGCIDVIGTTVYFGPRRLDLPADGLMLRLFRLFAVARDGRCSLREILAVVYQFRTTTENSKRYRKSARIRAVKLISRARRLAKEHFCPGIDWFNYESGTRTWRLYGRGGSNVYLQ